MSRSTQDLLEQARAALAAGNTAIAEKIIELILRNDPNEISALVLLANVHLSRNLQAEARSLAFQALTLDPNYAEAFYLLAYIDYTQRQNISAIGWITKAIEHSPEQPNFLGFKSMLVSIEFHDAASARALALQGLNIDPTNSLCQLALFQVEKQEGNLPAAERYIKNALRNNPDDPFLHAYFSGLLLEQGDQDSAMQSVLTALRKDPNSRFFLEKWRLVTAAKSPTLRSLSTIISSTSFAIVLKILIGSSLFIAMVAIIALMFNSRWMIVGCFGFFLLLIWLINSKKSLLVAQNFFVRTMHSGAGNWNKWHKLCIEFAIVLFFSLVPIAVLTGIVWANAYQQELILSITMILSCAFLFWEMSERKSDQIRQHRLQFIHMAGCAIAGSMLFFFPTNGYWFSFFVFLLTVQLFWLRSRYQFNKKYDLSNTLSTNDQY
ncbi:MAG: tetratricopeptide repeat protein [Chitinophagaceae bacterium]